MCIPIVSKITRPGIQKNVAVFGVSKSIQKVSKTQRLPPKGQITLKSPKKYPNVFKNIEKYPKPLEF